MKSQKKDRCRNGKVDGSILKEKLDAGSGGGGPQVNFYATQKPPSTSMSKSTGLSKRSAFRKGESSPRMLSINERDDERTLYLFNRKKTVRANAMMALK
mgnify:CR=1 FL=1